MLEIVMPGTRHGQAKMYSSSAYRGTLCYLYGVDADGYQLMMLPRSSAQAARAYFPVNKLYFEEYYNDTSASVDKIAYGDMCIYYEGGEYITDRVNIKTFSPLNAQYWANLETTSSAEAHTMYVPGTNTAIATIGLLKCYVSTGDGGGYKLYGDTSFSRGSGQYASSADKHVAYAVGIYAQDSANARIRFRIDRNKYYGTFGSL